MNYKKIFMVVLLIMFKSYGSQAQEIWMAMTSVHPKEVTPQFSYYPKKLSIRIQIPGFYKQWSSQQQRYFIRIPGAGKDYTPNFPQLPLLSYIIALPSTTITSFQIEYITTMTFPNIPVVINSTDLFQDYSCQKKENQAFLKNSFIPSENKRELAKVWIQTLGHIHGWQIVQISILPFYANIVSQDLKAAEHFYIHIYFANSTKSFPKFISPIVKDIVQFKPENSQTEEEIPEEYLIISPAHFTSALQPLINWRTAEGMLVTLKTIQEIKKNMGITGLLSAKLLHNYLALYYSKQPNLVYVLLVGDVEFIPVQYKNDDGTDFYYSLLDDTGDLLPDVYLGRLPVNTQAELVAVIDKIIQYEKMPPSKRVLLGAYFQDTGLDGISDRDYVYTSEQFRNYLIKRQYTCERVYTKTPGTTPKYYSNYTPVPPDITFQGTTQDIIRFINIGASVVNHRDHGDAQGWHHPSLRVQDLFQLWNKRYPLMFNVDCETGKFDAETAQERRETEGTPLSTRNESFSEQALTLPKRGMVAIIAPTRITTKSLNNVFDQGLMEALWPKMFGSWNSPATRLGQVLYRARIKLLREFGGNGWVNERILGNFRRYHIFGDPALRIQQPQ